MPSINYIIFSYRNAFFKKTYGAAVRDLQIIEILKRHPTTNSILIVDRPSSIYEIILGKTHNEDGYLNHISFDLLGPLKKRSWTENCYKKSHATINRITAKWKNIVLLDFTPIAKIPFKQINHDIYWYDLIDNFKKHNRFTKPQLKLVGEKYETINEHADIITGVTSEALKQFPPQKTTTLPNGYYPQSEKIPSNNSTYKYGFIGFITDKFDIDFILELKKSDPEFSLVIYGDFFDRKTKFQLESIPGVYTKGRFKSAETHKIICTFKAGLIPYLQTKSHDESPLKLYEYISSGKPVITSTEYEFKSQHTINYNKTEINSVVAKINRIIANENHSSEIKATLTRDHYIESGVHKVVEKLESIFLENTSSQETK